MRRVLAVAALAFLGLVVSEGRAAAGGLDLRAGAFFPRADSNLFRDDEELYTVTKGDWIGFYGGAEYYFNVSDHVEVGLHLDGYGRSIDTVYRDFTRPGGAEIFQTLQLETLPLGASVRFVARPERGAFTPYVAVGPDAVFYEYEEFGDFIDFFSPDLDIVPDHFIDHGVAFGVHAAVGLRFPINEDFAIVAEGRYLWSKTDMGEDFRGNKIDLSGPSATLGVNIKF